MNIVITFLILFFSHVAQYCYSIYSRCVCVCACVYTYMYDVRIFVCVENPIDICKQNSSRRLYTSNIISFKA